MLSVLYRKGQKHACDPACRAAGHVYRHTYKKPLPFVKGKDGQVAAPARFFTRDDGATELYATDNPPLLIVNSPKTQRRNKPMATFRMKRNGKGQFVAVRNSPKRRRKARKNPPFWSAGALVNPRKGRKKKHAPRHNPPAKAARRMASVLGFPLVFPEISDILGITAGLAGPPLVKGFAMQMLPASVTTTSMGKIGVEAGSYILPAAAGYMLGGRQGLKMVLAGEAAAVAVRLVGDLTARISGSLPTMSNYNTRVTGNYTRAQGLGRMGSYMKPVEGRRMLGAYANSRQSPRGMSNHSGRRTR